MSKIKITVLVSTYNRPDALSVCLDSFRHQTLMPDEIIIADDGSKEETIETIKQIQQTFPVPIVHVWQEDDGFRKSMILNKTVAKAIGDYIIEIDGDAFAHPKFIEDHMRLAQKGRYVKGGRVNLNKELSDDICKSRKSRPIHAWTKGIISKKENALRLKALSLYLAPRYRQNASPGLGCNMSFWKEDYIKINGYDEAYTGWGCEDFDFGRRLQNSGLQKRYLKFAGIVYHLWHKENFRENVKNNQAREQEQIKKQAVRCEVGVDQYLNKEL